MLFFKILLVIVVLSLVLVACWPKKKASLETANYALENPDKKYILPPELKEISGISFYDENTLACVNDEEGTVFMYDLASKSIKNTFEIAKNGDYEGIEVVGNEVFMMKSDGKIISYNFETKSKKEIDCSTDEVKEYEGLAYNRLTNSLLLAAKEQKKQQNDEKNIYAYSLETKQFSKLLTISLDLMKGEKNKKKFAPSGIAVHPISGHFYVLSSQIKKLLVISPNGKESALFDLKNDLFVQPEGICFASNGDMYISSEGDNGDGYILSFPYSN